VSRTVARQLALSADFVIVLGVAIALLALVAAEQAGRPLAAVQVPLGLAYVLLVPGYCLTVAIFPRADDLDGVERLGLAVGLSLASTAILALVLDRLPWGLRTWPILAGEYVLTIVFAAAASLRRMRIENAGSTTAAVLRPRQWWRSEPPSQRQAYRRIALLSVFVAGLCAAVFLSPPLDNSLSTFYALGPAGQVADYPYRVAVGDTVAVTIGIDNQTHAAVRYRYEIWERAAGDSDGGVPLVTSETFELGPGETRQESVSWRMTHVGPRQRVDALLFEDDEASPSRQLRFWVDVSDVSPPP
jgi:uncharacterized membrane protein